MEISILYWGVWNYKPQAVSLADEINGQFAEAKVEIIEGSGGVFDVTVDGKLIFSKKETDRFPEENEVYDLINSWFFIA